MNEDIFAPPISPRHFPPTPSPQILMVNEDIAVRQLDTEALSSAGYRVDTAADGATAWEVLKSGSHDLLITANRLLTVSGVEWINQVHSAYRALPVILAMSAWPNQEFTRHPWIKPPVMLLKPYTVEELLRIVKKVLRDGSRRDDGAQLLLFPGLNLVRTLPAEHPGSAARIAPALFTSSPPRAG